MPDLIDNTNFKYVLVDNKYVISFNVISLPEYIFFLDIVKDLDKTMDYDMSIYISKLDPVNVLSKLTYNITLNRGEISTVNRNQRNIDVINKSSVDSEELRKKIQLENEEIYGVNIILTIYSKDVTKLLKLTSIYKAKLFSKGIGAEITNFRHLEFYLSNIPLGIKNIFIQNNLIITTKALSNIFPFYTENIVDLCGIQLGITYVNKRICMVDIFSNKYENSNMCILGSSGSGKSYFTKLCILRNYFQNKIQIVLDIENEYGQLCKKLNGCNVFEEHGFNIFYITKNDLEEENFLDSKIQRITEFLLNILDIKIERNSLKKEVKSLYNLFGINDDINSVLKSSENDIVTLDYEIIDSEKFPTLLDLKNNTKYKTLKKALSESLNLDLKHFLYKPKPVYDSKLFVLNMSHFKSNEKILIEILEYIKRHLKEDRKTIIYIDELFKYSRYEKVLDIVSEMYKSIRKRNASIITITQDITDFFKFRNGYYMNSILNNSNFKLVFKTEYEENNAFEKLIDIDREKIASLKKGEAYLIVNRNSVKLQITANDYERMLINENDHSD